MILINPQQFGLIDMGQGEIKIKSNGLRNELKEIRKSIDRLTEVLLQQTHKHYENTINNACCNDDELCKCKNRKIGKLQADD